MGVNSVREDYSMKLIESGVMTSRNDIMGIKKVLMNRRQNAEYIV